MKPTNKNSTITITPFYVDKDALWKMMEKPGKRVTKEELIKRLSPPKEKDN